MTIENFFMHLGAAFIGGLIPVLIYHFIWKIGPRIPEKIQLDISIEHHEDSVRPVLVFKNLGKNSVNIKHESDSCCSACALEPGRIFQLGL